MPAHTRRQIDPTPEQLAALLADVFRRAAQDALAGGYDPRDGPPAYDGSAPSWNELLTLAAERPQGVYARRHRIDWRTEPLLFGACWWADVLGRRHWLAQAGVGAEPYSIGALAEEFGQGDGLVEGRHPLEWIAPELSSGHRGREFVVVCRCGFAGPPESLAWTGALCGPCFDREQEGLPPAGKVPTLKDVGLIDEFELTDAGRLVAARPGPSGTTLRVWDAPWAGKPRWSREWSQYRNHTLSPGGVLAVEASPGRVTLVGLDDGRTRDSRDLAITGDVAWMAFAGKDGERLVVNVTSPSGGYLRAWAVTPDGALGGPLYLHEHRRVLGAAFAVSPRGQRLLVAGGRAVEVRDADTGEVRERLSLPSGGGRVSALLALPDGSAVAARHMDDREPPALHRWGPKGEHQPGLFSWLTTPAGRGPDVTRAVSGSCEALAASPDGRRVASVEGELVVRDAATLEERGRFRPSLAELYPSVAFTPDGQLLALTDRGLAAWPVKELFG